MKFFNTILHKSKSLDTMPEISTEPNTIYAPFAGKVIPLKEINDGVFSAGILGQGLGFCPDEETVYLVLPVSSSSRKSPFNMSLSL